MSLVLRVDELNWTHRTQHNNLRVCRLYASDHYIYRAINKIPLRGSNGATNLRVSRHAQYHSAAWSEHVQFSASTPWRWQILHDPRGCLQIYQARPCLRYLRYNGCSNVVISLLDRQNKVHIKLTTCHPSCQNCFTSLDKASGELRIIPLVSGLSE